MESIGQELTGKIGTLSFNEKMIMTEIKKISKEHIALKIFSFNELKEFRTDQICQLTVEKEEDKSVYLFSIKIESIHKFDHEVFVFAKPLSSSKEVNRREGHRLSTSLYFGKTIFSQYRPFPPIDKKWKKAKVIDVSEGGVQLLGTDFFSRGQIIEVILTSPILQENEIILMEIVNVLTEEKGYIYSMKFLNISSKQLEHLKKLINKAIHVFNKSS